MAGLVEGRIASDFGGRLGPGAGLIMLAATATAVGLSRRAPAAALALVWATALTQTAFVIPVQLVEAGFVAVAFGTARWGRSATVWAAAVSIPAGAALALELNNLGAFDLSYALANYGRLFRIAYRISDFWQVGAAVIGAGVLGVPWLAGLVLRISDRARREAAEAAEELSRAEAGRAQASEIAMIREEQARLARDVHDVVGHSLAVILAQAESGQYLSDDDPETLKTTLATIAASARASLGDVRQVLSATHDPDPARTHDLGRLIEGLRTSGREVVSAVTGAPRPLPPELEVTAFRLLQEMLTNAIKHSPAGSAILVDRTWPAPHAPGPLVIEVRNATVTPPAAGPNLAGPNLAGQGLAGMRRRLENVGGRLTAGRRGEIFRATAEVPLR